jgi:excisionase family DNA binding protein
MNETVTVPASDRETDFVTAHEAAAILRISQSTLWRWLGSGVLQGYRRGGRRVWLRRSELAAVAVPVAREAPATRKLTAAQQQQMLDAVATARRLHAQQLKQRDGRPFPSSVELIREARQARSAVRG